MSATILKAQDWKKARARFLGMLLTHTKVISRRADHPEDRAALAELERELLNLQERWSTAGLVEALKSEGKL